MRLCTSSKCQLSLGLLFVLGLCRIQGGEIPNGKKFFDQKVAPLLASRCLECHSGAKPKGKLDLSDPQRALKGGRHGQAIVPGKPESSLLWERVKDNEMPPREPLTREEKKILQQWLQSGAAWGSGPIDLFRYTTAKRGGYDWWSLQPVKRPELPEVEDRAWSRNPIDRFILNRLEAQGLEPSERAGARAWIRRAYFDVIGLPPSPGEVEAFVANPTEQAYQQVVDWLLASPHYGERWGRHWLDVVRFGESDGFERNNPRKTAWHYRDWVVRAFNRDMPYDQFARRQLIGDLEDASVDGAAAVGFLVAGVHNTVVGSSERMKRLAKQDELEEKIGTIGQTFLGLTVNCARCHDHKFDPIRTKEYYQLISSIDGIAHGERTASGLTGSTQIATLQREIKEARKSLQQIEEMARKAILAERKKKPRSPATDRPTPYASWAFEKDLRDGAGKLHGIAHGAARLENGTLVLDGRRSYVTTAPLDKDLQEITLEAWVILGNLQQRGGGVVSIETQNGNVFNAIVFGEREPFRWMAGSDGFRRTQSFQGPPEKEATEKPVHIAISWARNGTITAYRNGLLYGKPYKTGTVSFAKGSAHIAFGIRHLPAGSNKMLQGKILQANLYDRALGPQAIAASAGVESDYVSTEAISQWLPKDQLAIRNRLKKRLAILEREEQRLLQSDKVKLYTALPRRPSAMKVHIRGSVTDYGEVVSPGGVAAVRGPQANFGLKANASDAERRKALARWITHPSNPLFSRVIVNRLWHYHFGTGIVETPNDLGFNGGRPSHPKLLDWMADYLRSHGYRLKPLHRLILTSATYRQSSRMRAEARAKDANNRLLWRYSPRRLEAEALRDAMLQVSGELSTQAGGPGFEDVLIRPNNGTTYYHPVTRSGYPHNRRTIYRFTPRGGRNAVLDTFDCPDPSSTAPRRTVTTTPLQALSLLNNDFVLHTSERLAARTVNEGHKTVTDQVSRVWHLILGRAPQPDEAQMAIDLVKAHGLDSLCRALFNTNEFLILE